MRYFINDSQDSLSFKFRNQIKAAQNIGLDVWYLAIEDNSIFLIHDEEKVKLLTYSVSYSKTLLNTIKLYVLLYKAIPKCFEVKDCFDIVYIREMTATPSLLHSLRLIKKHGSKIIVEIPTYPSIHEENLERRLTRKIIFKCSKVFDVIKNKYVDFYTLIGDKAESYMNKPALNIDNGICLDFIPLRKSEINCNEIHCLGLASMSRWQGYDRFIQGLYEYKQNGGSERIFLHLAGSEGDGSLDEWKKLSVLYNLEESVIYEGPVYGEELDRLFDLCDIGLGTLAGHRTREGISSALKVREYVARGLPFIYSGKDNLINKNLDFVFEVPKNNTPIDMKTVVEFVKYTKNKPFLIEKMRNYAEKYMTWEEQMNKIIKWVEVQR